MVTWGEDRSERRIRDSFRKWFHGPPTKVDWIACSLIWVALLVAVILW